MDLPAFDTAVTAWFSTFLSWLKLGRQRLTGAPLLIVERPGGIGDLLCVLPAAAALKTKHPGARLIFFTSRDFVPLMELSELADCVVPAETRGLSRLRKWLRPVLDIYPLLPDELTPAQPRGRIHLIEEFARALNVQDIALQHPRLTPLSRDIERMKSLLKKNGLAHSPFVVMHAGPTWAVKQWPLKKWAALAARLQQEQGMQTIQM
ncbi:MAG: putative Lipopolysaccharide heptosyltransferase, partial [Verrucomicrobiaceae bacterium]|nr:putative Lipopolysaccharide heptosyltransferase [Verrucomicrobiaceae bacterium]